MLVQHIHNQVSEPRCVLVKGDTNYQGVPFSLIALRGNEFAHFQSKLQSTSSDRSPPPHSSQGTPKCSPPISQIICISFSATPLMKNLWEIDTIDKSH